MSLQEREDDFESRRAHLREMSDEALHDYFWSLTHEIVAPLIEAARTHTTPAIERSVLLRMGFSSVEAKALVDGFAERRLLGQGAGRLILDLARTRRITVRDAGVALIEGRHWEEVAP